MEVLTSKIVDNTFISACIYEINSVDILKTSSLQYNFITSEIVQIETNDGDFDIDLVNDAYGIISPVNLNHDKYDELREYLLNRYPKLHDGEVSAFLLALLEYGINGLKYYYITDDAIMKKTILNLNNDEQFLSMLEESFDFENFNVTGTIGFIRRLIDNKYLDEKHIEDILIDLENNGFYLNEKIKNHLRGI
ncbi:hypothetical protein MARBORIA2_06490 [Methanobrevibacter arboriphilus]|uniref:hypothetical protein n=1 Tax=Methanobrevibacter arboriphilus TaxID=39441 RepID=UPI0022EECA8C|nr:hypothetical protein [Methanobrevibacter arboriphilus]GLI11559.1 hypothetical protein MARBORIA2_06490 [Methanobrevibacter arboriphilus]